MDSEEVTSNANVWIPADDSAVILEVSRAAAKTCRSPWLWRASASAEPRELSEHPVTKTVRSAEDICEIETFVRAQCKVCGNDVICMCR